MRRHVLRTAFVALLSHAALAQPSPAASPTMPGMTSGHSAADQAMMAGMNKMNQAMNDAPMSGDPDRDFVAMMIPHHQGAIDMAKTELQFGKNPMLRKLARAIIAAQQTEIAEMTQWQTRHSAQ
jgi:uncharacterized protein (DUF305 family)